MTFETLYDQIRNGAIGFALAASIFSGFRIYVRWNNGDDIEISLYTWLMSPVWIMLADQVIYDFAFNRAYAGRSNAAYEGAKFANDALGMCMILGVIVAIFGLYKMVNKFRNGDQDIYQYMIKWVGSLIFLFFIGVILSAIL